MSKNVSGKHHKPYEEEFRRQAVEMIIREGKPLAQVARELGVSEYSLHLWRKRYLGRMESTVVDGREMTPEQMAKEIQRQHREIEYLKRQREILKKAMSILGEEPTSSMR